jgi:redox-sensitive bicupin YhaK (pirin superfamily)
MKKRVQTSAQWIMSRVVIDDADVHGSLKLLAPGMEAALDPVAHDRICFVSAGSVTLDRGELNTMLLEDEVGRIRKHEAIVIRNHGSVAAKVLLLELPPVPVEYVPAGLIHDETPLV